MESSVLSDLDFQLTYLQQITRITESLKEKCAKLEIDKNEAQKKYESIKDKLERLNNKTCSNCIFLENELKREQKEKEILKKNEKAKLLRTIARTLENLEDGNTHHVNQLLTELNCGILSESPEQNDNKHITLIEDRETSEDEESSNILVDETMISAEDNCVSSAYKYQPIIVPETEVGHFPQKTTAKKFFEDIKTSKLKNRIYNQSNENVFSSGENDVVEQANKKMRLSPILSSQKVSPPRDKMPANLSSRSPSVLSEIIEAVGGSTSSSSCQDEKGVAWKMKPSVVTDVVTTSAAGGKKLKQMTLSLTRTEKKHDISLSDKFRGGVAKYSDEDDIVQPSPEQNSKKIFVKKTAVVGTLDDPDVTVFNPVVTSTCLPEPGNTSFDRLPEVPKSPKYKYRRETLRKKCDRMKLPGQDCDHCAKYYEAAGLDQSQEVKTRLNQCSRHRDKFNLRFHTPPDFWDPVIPTTPEDRQNHL